MIKIIKLFQKKKKQNYQIRVVWYSPFSKKMRLKMVIEMHIEIPDGGEILVNYRFKFNYSLNLNLYREK